MENKGLTCCVTGHRPKGFPWDYSDTEGASHQEYLEAMACYIDKVIRKDGVVNFMPGVLSVLILTLPKPCLIFVTTSMTIFAWRLLFPARDRMLDGRNKARLRYKRILERV